MKCEYKVTGEFEVRAHKEFLVVFAVWTEIPDLHTYDSDSTILTCGYQGADKALIIW